MTLRAIAEARPLLQWAITAYAILQCESPLVGLSLLAAHLYVTWPPKPKESPAHDA